MIITFSCSSSFKNTELPANMPDDIIIHYSEDGGMLPIVEEIHLSMNESYYRTFYHYINNKTPFSAGKAALNDLFLVFKSNKINNIESRKEIVMDRGGIIINISWERTRPWKKMINLIDSGFFFIKDEYKKNFQNIVDAIKKTADYELDKKRIKGKLIIADNVDIPHYCHITLSNEHLYHKEKDQLPHSININKEIKFLPGKYSLEAGIIVDKKNIFKKETIELDEKIISISINIRNDTNPGDDTIKYIIQFAVNRR